VKLVSIALVAAAAAILSTGTAAAPTPLSPAPGSSTTSTHPTFRWMVKAPEVSDSIAIAKSPRLTASGEFVTANIVDVDDLEEDATSWSPTRPLPVGTFYWHVGSIDTTPGSNAKTFTATAKLTIRAAVVAQSFQLQWSGRQFLETLTLKANVQQVNVLVKLLAGTRVLGAHRATTNNFLVDALTRDQGVFTVPTSVKRGTKLRLVATLTVKGDTAKATVSKTLRAP
jgi:hypothetical protein